MPQEKHKIVSDITIEDVKLFYETIFKQPVYIQTLVQGNITSQEAIDVFEVTAKTFNATDDTSNFEIPEIIMAKIPTEGTKVVRLDGFNPKDNNTIISNYYQYGPGSFETTLLLDVGCQIMKEPIFNTLRTVEHLGYDVRSQLTVTNGIVGISIFVNSSLHELS